MSEGSDYHPFHGQQSESQTQTAPAKYVFNEKVEIFADTVKLIAKFSDSIMVEFGDGSLYIEALSATKSAQANALFEGNSIAEWNYGDLGAITDKRIQLSTKQFVGALRNVTKQDTLYFYIKGISCDRVSIEYTNARYVTRQYQLQARDVSEAYNRPRYPREVFSNKIVCSIHYFKNIFKQLSDGDEMCFQCYPDHSVITKYITENNPENVATFHSVQAGDSYEIYEIAVPMSMIVSVKELKTALKLIGVHSNLAHIFFGLGSKPMLVTFDDENKEEQCRAIISLADTHEINEDEEQSQAAATQSGVINNSHDRSLQSSNGFVPSQNSSRQQQQRHNDGEEPPLKQRRKAAPNNILNNRSKRGFSFEDDVADENEEIHQVQNDSNDDSEIFPSSGNRDGDVRGSRNSSLNNRSFQPQNSINNANSSLNNRSFQQHDFDDIQIAPSPSAPPPPPPPERNSTSPYCIALRLLGIEDQISDPEAEDVLETYDLPSTDPNEDLYIMSQFPG